MSNKIASRTVVGHCDNCGRLIYAGQTTRYYVRFQHRHYCFCDRCVKAVGPKPQETATIPIKDISAWLATYATPPRYALEIFPESGHCLANTLAAAWEHHIRTMIEDGLTEEEHGNDL